MRRISTIKATDNLEAITQRINDAIESLAGAQNISIERARAIYNCASTIIDSVKVEIQRSDIKRE